MNSILCSISTRGRYDTTLPLAIQSVAMQELLPDALVIFDDNDNPKDIRNIQQYEYLLRILDEKGVKWSVEFGSKMGQHYNHQRANKMDYRYVWRIDDDCVAEPNVLKKLFSEMKDHVGAVGGSILTPPFPKNIRATGKIENINTEPSLQWDYIKETKEVDHLHCSYLYRTGIMDFDLSLSRIAFREETLHTYGIKKKGYKVLITDCVTWHLRNKEGGCRSHSDISNYEHDDNIFKKKMSEWNIEDNNKMVVLDSGLGDHYAFKNILGKLKSNHLKITLAVCYPEVFEGDGVELISIADAIGILGDRINNHNIYKFMADRNWDKSLVEAFECMHLS